MLRTGTYQTTTGENAHLTVTSTGYVVRYADGTVTTIGRAS